MEKEENAGCNYFHLFCDELLGYKTAVGKIGTAQYEQFLLIPESFQKICFADVEKQGFFCGRGLSKDLFNGKQQFPL